MRVFMNRRGPLPSGFIVACALMTLAVVPSAAKASAAPTVHTGEASPVTQSAATLHGSIFPSSQSTSFYFEYGPTSTYGSQTATVLAGAGTHTLYVAAMIAGLSPFTVYHYRLVAINSSGTTVGQEATFTTMKTPLAFRLATTASSVLVNTPFTVSGQVSGTDSAARAIVLQANPFPYLGGFKNVGSPELTDANGAFSFPVAGLQLDTELRVATVGAPLVASTARIELVAVRVTLHLRPSFRHGYVRLYGTVTPSEAGAHVSFQLLRHGRAPRYVGGTVVRRAISSVSQFSGLLRIRRPGLYNAYVTVVSGAQVSNRSRPILIR